MKISLDHLVAIFSDRNLFPRRRTPPLIKALAVKTYVEGLSFRRVANVLSELGFKASYEAVRDWFHTVGELLSKTIKHRRGFIAIDETVVWNLVKRAYLWAAREIRSGDVVAIQVSRGRGIAECLRFMEIVKDSCVNKPTIYTDRGPWYDWPMAFLKLRRRRKTFGRRNSIESWFSKLKRRIRQFNVCFPTYSPRVLESWIRVWVALSWQSPLDEISELSHFLLSRIIFLRRLEATSVLQPHWLKNQYEAFSI
jgi:transposase-like protein